MAHVQKRLLSRVASSVSVHATAAKFPPKEALYSPNKPQRFEPETWAALQPPPPSALSSLSHRIGLAPLLNEELTLQVCTHSSFIPFHEYHRPDAPKPASNAQLAAVGNSLMGLFATEHVHATYPYLPTRVLKAAITAHVGPLSCANVAQEMGAAHLLRWRRLVSYPSSITYNTVSSPWLPFSLIRRHDKESYFPTRWPLSPAPLLLLFTRSGLFWLPGNSSNHIS